MKIKKTGLVSRAGFFICQQITLVQASAWPTYFIQASTYINHHRFRRPRPKQLLPSFYPFP